MSTDPVQPFGDDKPRNSARRAWLHRISLLLCLVCALMLGIGIAVEVATRNLIFEDYISTFSAYGIILAVVAALSRPSRCGG